MHGFQNYFAQMFSLMSSSVIWNICFGGLKVKVKLEGHSAVDNFFVDGVQYSLCLWNLVYPKTRRCTGMTINDPELFLIILWDSDTLFCIILISILQLRIDDTVFLSILSDSLFCIIIFISVPQLRINDAVNKYRSVWLPQDTPWHPRTALFVCSIYHMSV